MIPVPAARPRDGREAIGEPDRRLTADRSAIASGGDCASRGSRRPPPLRPPPQIPRATGPSSTPRGPVCSRRTSRRARPTSSRTASGIRSRASLERAPSPGISPRPSACSPSLSTSLYIWFYAWRCGDPTHRLAQARRPHGPVRRRSPAGRLGAGPTRPTLKNAQGAYARKRATHTAADIKLTLLRPCARRLQGIE